MGALDPRVTGALDELVPPRPRPDHWDAVVAAAGVDRSGRRRGVVTALPVAAAALAVAVLALAWPFGGGPHDAILERAAAAIGDGPVIHLVVRSGYSGAKLVDLETGERRVIHGEDEIWYDTASGLTHIVSRFGGVVERDELFQRRQLGLFEKKVIGLARDYRDGLRAGAVQVLEDGVVDGEPVHWLRVDTAAYPEAVDGVARDIGVSQKTFEVVATRGITGGIERILEVETLAAGEGDFSGELRGRAPATAFVFQPFASVLLRPSEAIAVAGRRALWAGRQIGGLELARIWTQWVEERRVPNELLRREEGVTFYYGSLAEMESEPGRPIGPDISQPYVSIGQSLTGAVAEHGPLPGYVPPEGSVLVSNGRTGVMVRDGLHISIHASSEELLMTAARALEPVPTG